MKDIIAIKYNLNTQKDYLKLKLESDTWLNEEANLIELKNKATLVGNVYDTLIVYLNQGFAKDSVDKIAEDYIKTFSLGDYI